MKKLFLISTILSLICSTASAAIFTSNLTCPSKFPSLPQSSVMGWGAGKNYFEVFHSNGGVIPYNFTTVIAVNADSDQDAISQSNAIMSSDLKPAWKQAKSTDSELNGFTEYYCAYVSNKYHLSTVNPASGLVPPIEAADYELFYRGK